MNISENTLKALNEGYTYAFYDANANAVSIEKAAEIRIGFAKENGDMFYVGKSIKATKKEMTFDYIMNKLNAESVYKNFCEYFNKLMVNKNLRGYPTSYGIGVFGLFGNSTDSRSEIEDTLTSLGIKFSTEYSYAGWVFRYKISQSEENISLLKSLLNS